MEEEKNNIVGKTVLVWESYNPKYDAVAIAETSQAVKVRIEKISWYGNETCEEFWIEKSKIEVVKT